MQAEIGGDRMRTGAARPTRWIPAEVWQRQGMTAQVLTLPGGNCNDFYFKFISSRSQDVVSIGFYKIHVNFAVNSTYMTTALQTRFRPSQTRINDHSIFLLFRT